MNQSSVSIKGRTNKIGRTETPLQTLEKQSPPPTLQQILPPTRCGSQRNDKTFRLPPQTM